MNRVIKQCTPENPYSKERDAPGVYWEHQEWEEVSDYEHMGTTFAIMKCKTCGKTWEDELPQ